MLVRRFKFKRSGDKGGFQWTAESKVERPGFYRGFHAVGRTLADVKEFATLVRWCERTGSLERLSETERMESFLCVLAGAPANRDRIAWKSAF